MRERKEQTSLFFVISAPKLFFLPIGGQPKLPAPSQSFFSIKIFLVMKL